MRASWTAVWALSTAVVGVVFISAIAGAAAQPRVNVPAPSLVKPIVPVPPSNWGYPGTLSIRPAGPIRCRRSCVKFGHGTPTHPRACRQWRVVC